MTDKDKIEKIAEYIQENFVRRDVKIGQDEDFNPMDASGGNFDDAFDLGVRSGTAYTLECIENILLGK